MEIDELYKSQTKRWRQHNQKLFGLTSVASDASAARITNQLKKDEQAFWRMGSCDLKDELLSNKKKIAQRDLLFEDTFELTYNPSSNIIMLSAQFLKAATLDGKQLNKKELAELAECLRELKSNKKPHNDRFAEAKVELIRADIAYLPLVTLLGYKMRKAEYTLRTQAVPVLKQTQYTKHDFRNFNYKYFSAVRALVLNSSKSANIEKGRVINIASRLKSQSKYTTSRTAALTSNLILTTTEIEALEVSRQVVYPSEKARGFSFTGLSAASVKSGGGGQTWLFRYAI